MDSPTQAQALRSESSERVVARCASITIAAAILAIVSSILVLIGWAFRIEILKRIVPGLVAMNPLTAVNFILCGAALFLMRGGRPRERSLFAARTAAGFVLGDAAVKLCGIVVGFDWQLDRILFSRQLDAAIGEGNPMAPTTALAFVFFGLALLLLDSPGRSGLRPAQPLSLAGSLVAMLALIGYLFSVRSLTGLASFIPMALPTAAAFFVLGCGVWCARPGEGWMAHVTSRREGSAMLRRLIAVIVGAPLLLGWCILAGHRGGVFTSEDAFSLLVVSVIMVFAALIWTNAALLDRKEGERLVTLAELHAARDSLEERVHQRTAHLSSVLAEIARGIEVLGASAKEVLAEAANLSEGSNGVARTLSETTGTLEDLRHAARVAAAEALHVAALAAAAVSSSETGKCAIHAVRLGSERIREQMDAIAQCMLELGEQSRAIGEIVAAVETISDQSTLLAVNASIEAARAGEHGKGFGVVAQEMRFLADQSKDSTRHVRSILNEIQKAANTVALAVEKGTQAAEDGGRQTRESGESILALTEGVVRSARAASEISVSAREQLSGLDQVVEAMRSVKETGLQHSESAARLETAAKRLDALGDSLKAAADRYPIG